MLSGPQSQRVIRSNSCRNIVWGFEGWKRQRSRGGARGVSGRQQRGRKPTTARAGCRACARPGPLPAGWSAPSSNLTRGPKLHKNPSLQSLCSAKYQNIAAVLFLPELEFRMSCQGTIWGGVSYTSSVMYIIWCLQASKGAAHREASEHQAVQSPALLG